MNPLAPHTITFFIELIASLGTAESTEVLRDIESLLLKCQRLTTKEGLLILAYVMGDNSQYESASADPLVLMP